MISAATALGLGYTAYQLSRIEGENRELRSQLADGQARLKNIELDQLQKHTDVQNVLIEKIREAQSIAQPQKQGASGSRAKLSVNSDSAKKGTGTDPQAINEKIDQEKATISELQENLRETRGQKHALRKQIHQDQATMQNEQKAANDQATAQINQQQQILEQLQGQFNSAKQTYGNNQFDLQAAQSMNDLQAKITTQRTLIQSLKDQRAADNSQSAFQRNTTLNQRQAQLDQLEESEDEISQQLEDERATLTELQSELNGGAGQ